VSFANAGGPLNLSLAITTAQANGGAGTDIILNFENLTGGGGGDILAGNAGNNILNGGDGTDTVTYAAASAAVNASLATFVATGAGTDAGQSLVTQCSIREALALNRRIAISNPDGTADFDTTRLGWDEVVRSIYYVTLRGAAPSYGEWRPMFDKEGNRFDVEVLSMGYSEWIYVGSNVGWHMNAKPDDIEATMKLTEQLFSNPNLRAAPIAPFSFPDAYTGRVIFKPGWFRPIR
jgi:RTX calcium-binding nonapeptide repeat (4 copies)